MRQGEEWYAAMESCRWTFSDPSDRNGKKKLQHKKTNLRLCYIFQEWEKKCPKFASFKEQQEALEDARRLKLNALLITPIQRVPRYKL